MNNIIPVLELYRLRNAVNQHLIQACAAHQRGSAALIDCLMTADHKIMQQSIQIAASEINTLKRQRNELTSKIKIAEQEATV